MGLVEEPLHEEELSSELAYEGVFLKVFRDRVRLPDGSEGVREFVRHPGAVVVIPVLPDGRLLFERQFRYPLARAFLEMPAGKIDEGESLLACAQRELEEETGYVAESWLHLGQMHPCIGYSDERIEIFLATGLSHVGHRWDEGEFLELLTLSLEEAEDAVLAGRITDSKTITALFWAGRVLRA
ncbi:MAG: NUDIX hydrolase [Rhodocyclaceae bacterium]|jgi:ADP-ribose pyrophosphatase|nr:NUDIX hydrolase [Rhodocyclaceae bacterium]